MSKISSFWKTTFNAIILLVVPYVSFADSSSPLVTAYTYHLKPPYVIDLEAEVGLYFDFVRYINKRVPSMQFHLTYLPRKRLDIFLEKKQLNGIVVGVNPAWFKDNKQEKYYWSSKIFDDRDDVVSNLESTIEYMGPKSLYGETIGGVLGYYYFGINEAVAAGNIKREDVVSEKALLEMIYHKRVSAGIVSNSTYNYLVVKHGWQGRFHLSEKPHDLYSRHVLIPRHNENVSAAISAVIEGMLKDIEWQRVLSKYQINF